MNEKIVLFFAVISIILLSGCVQLLYPNLPENLANVCLDKDSYWGSVFECESNEFGVKYITKIKLIELNGGYIGPASADGPGVAFYDNEGERIASCGGWGMNPISNCEELRNIKCETIICSVNAKPLT